MAKSIAGGSTKNPIKQNLMTFSDSDSENDKEKEIVKASKKKKTIKYSSTNSNSDQSSNTSKYPKNKSKSRLTKIKKFKGKIEESSSESDIDREYKAKSKVINKIDNSDTTIGKAIKKLQRRVYKTNSESENDETKIEDKLRLGVRKKARTKKIMQQKLETDSSSTEEQIKKLRKKTESHLKISNREIKQEYIDTINKQAIKTLEPKKFSNNISQNSDDWIRNFKKYVEYYKIPWSKTSELLTCYLDGKALDWYESTKEVITSYDNFLYLFNSTFCSNFCDDVIFKKLSDKHQEENESPLSFITDYIKLMNGLSYDMPEDVKVKMILAHLSKSYRSAFSLNKPKTLKKLKEDITELNCDFRINNISDRKETHYKQIKIKFCRICKISGHETTDCWFKEKDKKFCNICKMSSHIDADCYLRIKNEISISCNYCGRSGHKDSYCFFKKKDMAKPFCTLCKKQGHLENSCYIRRQPQKSKSYQTKPKTIFTKDKLN